MCMKCRCKQLNTIRYLLRQQAHFLFITGLQKRVKLFSWYYPTSCYFENTLSNSLEARIGIGKTHIGFNTFKVHKVLVLYPSVCLSHRLFLTAEPCKDIYEYAGMFKLVRIRNHLISSAIWDEFNYHELFQKANELYEPAARRLLIKAILTNDPDLV